VHKSLDREIARLKAHQVQLIETELGWCRALIQRIKGIGPRTALGLLGYCGDLRGFQRAKQLVAYIGINSGIYQSGGRLLGTSSISKQGPRRLRCLFYLAALSASQHNRRCRLLYERLLKKGKPKKVALIAVANKLGRQVFAVVKSQGPYQDDYELKRRHQAQRTSKKTLQLT
jgi:transposase